MSSGFANQTRNPPVGANPSSDQWGCPWLGFKNFNCRNRRRIGGGGFLGYGIWPALLSRMGADAI